MVVEDKNLVLAVFQVVALSLTGVKNKQKFFIMDFIPDLSLDYFFKEKSY